MNERRARRWGVVLGAAAWLAAGAAAAETAFVQGEVRLNLRTGPSAGHRIIGGVATGDQVDVLQRGDGWVLVRASGREGWIPAGYLGTEIPPSRRLETLEAEATSLRDRVAALSAENAELRSGSETSQERESQQRGELERLTAENRALRAGARWPHWITGASILAAGMAGGAALARLSGRRSPRRIRLS